MVLDMVQVLHNGLMHGNVKYRDNSIILDL